jgi:hypothetical protein
VLVLQVLLLLLLLPLMLLLLLRLDMGVGVVVVVEVLVTVKTMPLVLMSMPAPAIPARISGSPPRAAPPRAGAHLSRNMKCAWFRRRQRRRFARLRKYNASSWFYVFV